MKIFFSSLMAILVVAAIIAVFIGINNPHQQLLTSRTQAARIRELTAQLQRQADRMNRETEGLEPQNVVTTNQDLSFASPGGQLVIPARTTLHVVGFWGDNVVVQYNGIEVSLPMSSVDFH